MRHRLIRVAILLAACSFVSAEAPHATAPLFEADPTSLVVHEWGTFTSVAGLDGAAVEWAPLVAPSDLPCFVDKVAFGNKGWIPGTVRMETPVLYFYTAEDRTVDVRVRFRKGVITEWYPNADVCPMKIEPDTMRKADLGSVAEWKNVQILPKADETYPRESEGSHYYAARETDAAPLQVGDEREKLLFYRGVGMFAPPLTAAIHDDGELTLEAASGNVGDVVLFENKGGVTSFRSLKVRGNNVRLPFQPARGSEKAVHAHLVKLLVSHGLFTREAKAMVETWRDSWFEEGTRVFYIAPRAMVDATLPLEISPAPTSIERVFVGRIELFPRWAIDQVKTAILKGDRTTIAKRGRFFGPILQRLGEVDQAGYASVLPQLADSYQAAIGKRRSCRE
jgi:hypothetical protein